VQAGHYFAAKQHICENCTQSVGKHCKSNHDVQRGDSADAHRKTVYHKIVREKAAKYLILLEAGTGIEPVYTDLQSAA
jgi:hypothetical protein